MGMVVRSNIMAMNANRSLGMNNSQVSKNLEKLSSGFRINRAGDDASGLAISEKMKAQIKGLETASSNSQDGISLVQTAEGALTEVHSMLNRMVELAGKSANGTMDDSVDRNALQQEVDSLISEIDRISQGTNFNGIKLLDGSMDSTFALTPPTTGLVAAEGITSIDLSKLSSKNELAATVDVAKSALSIAYDNTTKEFTMTYQADNASAVVTEKIKVTVPAQGETSTVTFSNGLKIGFNAALDGTIADTALVAGKTGGGLSLQVGDTAEGFNQVTVSVGNMSSNGLGLTGLSVETQDDAKAALTALRGNLAQGGVGAGAVRGAINVVSDNRAAMGALQNRLEYTINNLDVAAENMTAANSRIRDTDMAKQMMEYTKSNVLTQAAQAMLAQANQQPQSVLQLLQ